MSVLENFEHNRAASPMGSGLIGDWCLAAAAFLLVTHYLTSKTSYHPPPPRTSSTPDIHHTRHSPRQIFTIQDIHHPDIHHTRHSPHQIFNKPDIHQIRENYHTNHDAMSWCTLLVTHPGRLVLEGVNEFTFTFPSESFQIFVKKSLSRPNYFLDFPHYRVKI